MGYFFGPLIIISLILYLNIKKSQESDFWLFIFAFLIDTYIHLVYNICRK